MTASAVAPVCLDAHRIETWNFSHFLFVPIRVDGQMNFVNKEFYPIEICHSRFLNFKFITDPKPFLIFDIYTNKIRVYFDHVFG